MPVFTRFAFVYCVILISQMLASSSSCPYIRTSVILAECVFDTSLYISLGAHVFNSNSINFLGHYSVNSYTNMTENLLNKTLIYNLGSRWMLLLPLLLKCSNQPANLTFTECQYTMRQTKSPSQSSSIAEYMTTQLSVINLADLGMQSILFLQSGEITLRSCKAYDCSKELVYLTASNETFNFQINYEKPIGTRCQSNEDCSAPYSSTDHLSQCDQVSNTCQCSDETITTMDVAGIGRLCTDSIDRSNCTKVPQRCLQWCNESETSHCICPKYTRKVRRIQGVFDCELEPTGICRFDDERDVGFNIRKCPTGTICNDNRCRPLIKLRQMSEALSDESFLFSTPTSIFELFSSPSKQKNQITTNFIRILITISIASLLFFIVIICIITMLVKSHRFRASSLSEDKVSSSSFAQSTSTGISTDISNEIYQIQSQQQPIISTQYSRRYENYFPTRPTFTHGLVPKTTLSPRFYRQYHGFDERRRRAPLYIQSPSIASVNRSTDQNFLSTNPYANTKNRTHLPIVTHLHNGDVLISA